MTRPPGLRSRLARGPGDLRAARPYLSRAGWALIDQTLSTGTNFGLVVLVARQSDPAGFGHFALALAVFSLVQGTARAAVGESLLVLDGAADDGEIRRTTVAAAPTSLAIAAAAVLVTSPLWVTGGPGVAAAFALAGGGLLLTDLVRYGYFAMRRPHLAAAVDALWAVLMAAAIVVFAPRAAGSTVLVWGVAGSAAGLIPLLSWRLLPGLADARRWWSRARALAVRFGTEFLAGSGAGHLALLVTGGLASAEAAGGLRAAVLLFGPVNLAFQALTPQAIVEGLDLARRRRPLQRTFAGLISSAFVLAVAVWTVVLVQLPDPVGRAVLGSTWVAAREVVPAYATYAAVGAVVAGAFVGLRVRAAASQSLRARVVSALGTLAGAGLGAHLGGAVGAAAGMAAGALLGAFVWWRALLAGPRGVAIERPGAVGPDPLTSADAP